MSVHLQFDRVTQYPPTFQSLPMFHKEVTYHPIYLTYIRVHQIFQKPQTQP